MKRGDFQYDTETKRQSGGRMENRKPKTLKTQKYINAMLIVCSPAS